MVKISTTMEHKIKWMKNYFGFIIRIMDSSKPVLRQLYKIASSDVRTVTGCNLRNILLLTDRLQVEDLEPSLVDNIMYHKIEDKDMWKIGMVKELLDIKHGDVHLPEGWSEGELDKILDYACIQ